jgi:hypothetical protein
VDQKGLIEDYFAQMEKLFGLGEKQNKPAAVVE